MIRTLMIVAAFAVAGFPLAYALTRRIALAAVLSPITSALSATVGVLLMVCLGGPLPLWLGLAYAAQIAMAAVLLRRRRTADPATTADVLWLGVPLLAPTTYAMAPPMSWDAHSIWWLHAGYFAHDGAYARRAIAEPALFFSHTDYPPLPSAPVALVWRVLSQPDFQAAHLVSALLTFSAIMLLALAVRRSLSAALAALARCAGVAVALTVWATAPMLVTSGLSDALWAAAFVAGALPYLLRRPASAVDLMLLTVAALAKNEGFIAVFILAVVLSVRPRSRAHLLLWLPACAGIGWAVLSRALGATSDLQKGGRFGGLLSGDPVVWRRLSPTISALWHQAGTVLVIALVVTVVGGLWLRDRRRRLGLACDLRLWLVLAGYAASLVLTYLISPNDIRWHLATSADRVSLTLVVLACANLAISAVVALPAKRPHPDATPSNIPSEATPSSLADAPPSATSAAEGTLSAGS
jgi:hypothetical protein